MPDSLSLARLLREQSRVRGGHPLLVCDSERIGYSEADRRSAQLARGLIALGAGKGTHVGLLYPNGVSFVIGMLAAARIGAVVVPFSTFAIGPEMHQQLVDSDVEILLAAASYRSHDYVQRLEEMPEVPALRHRIHDIDRVYRLAETVDEILLPAMEDDVDRSDTLAIVYTSGSTSGPKGVVHTHAALLAHQRNLNEIRGLTADDKLFCNSPFFWIGGFAFGLLATLVAGSTLVCSNAADAGETLDLLENEKPTVTNGFAASIAHLARHPSFAARDLSSLRRGNLYPIIAPDARPADPELRHNMLGMTEAGSVVLLSGDETDQPEHRRGSFGKPAPGFETKVVDPDSKEPVEVGEIGELCIRGRYLMQRYYRRSREECFDPDNWFHTEDLVRTDSDGFYYFIGRLGSMIKTAGANVSPAEVEKAIAKITGGTVAHIVGLPDPERGQQVAAVVVVRDGDQFDESALRHDLKSELSAYKIPTRFVRLSASEVPLQSSGKVDMQRLKKVFERERPSTIDALVRFRAARDGVKAAVIDPATRTTYRELDATTRELAAAFAGAGVRKDTRVGLIMPNSVRWVQVAVALTRIGAVLVPLSTLLQPRELVAQLRTASVQFLISVEEFRGHRYLDDLRSELDTANLGEDVLQNPKLPPLRHVWPAGRLARETPDDATARIADGLSGAVTPSDPMVIMFTSGSSGPPKGVVHSHGNALGAVASGLAARCIDGATRLYLPMPFFWVGGFGSGFLSALLAGATLVTEEVPQPQTTLPLLERERVTLFRG